MRTRIVLGAVALLAAVGCGKVKLPGGGESSDSGPPDATAVGPVSVTVLTFDGLRTPREGVDVGFFAPDGTHQATVATGADGVAASDLETGGTIVVFDTPPPAGTVSARAYAVFAVEPDDQIVIGGEPFPSGDAPVSMTITLPVVTGATLYQVATSCGNYSAGGEVVTVAVYPQCDPDTFSFVAVTSGGDGIRQYLREEDVPVVASGNYNAMASWQMMPTRPFLFTEVPGEVSTVEAQVMAVRAGDDQMDVSLGGDGAPVAGDMITVRPERIPSYDATMVWSQARPEQPVLGAFQMVRWLGPDDDTDANLGELMLPWMSPITYDSADRALRWGIIGDQAYDATYLTIVTSVNDGETFLETSWFLMAPPGIEEVVLPELPAAKAGFFLPDPEFVDTFGQIVENDQIDGYDGARQLGFDPSYMPRHQPLGAVVRRSLSGTTLR